MKSHSSLKIFISPSSQRHQKETEFEWSPEQKQAVKDALEASDLIASWYNSVCKSDVLTGGFGRK